MLNPDLPWHVAKSAVSAASYGNMTDCINHLSDASVVKYEMHAAPGCAHAERHPLRAAEDALR